MDSLQTSFLIPPCGGALVNLQVSAEETGELLARANTLPAIRLSERSLCDLEMLATGAFSPLKTFMGRADYRRVLDEMRLANGHIFPIPVTLPVEPNPSIQTGKDVALCNLKNEVLAILSVEEIYEWNAEEAALKIFATRDLRHPLVAEMNRWGRLNVSGRLRVLRLPRYYDFVSLRLTPAETRARLLEMKRPHVVAFQTRNPLHRAHEEMTRRAIEEKDAVLLLHPVVGMTKPGDVDHFSRVRTYKILTERYFERERVLLSLLPLAMRMAGPREALWHAVIRRNYGANFLIVGRDHASPGVDSEGKPFYAPYDAQELVQEFSEELGVGAVPFKELVYLPTEERYEELSKISDRTRTLSISGTEVREAYLEKGERLPEWFSRAEVSGILSRAFPPRSEQGVCIWLTGLSCAGKSTIAEILTTMLLEYGRRVTLLDGDVVRTHLSAGLGFSKADRDTNIRRIGFVASEIVRHGGVCICAAVSPYRATRNDVRNLIGTSHFIEVFVNTPLEICEARDTKGMYAKARHGEIKNFTGIDDPYEPPQHAEIEIDSFTDAPETSARMILDYLIQREFVRSGS